MPRIITTIVITLFFSLSAIYAQVGVGTTAPVGKLTVDASADTTAALELVPQPTPSTNLAAGQIAVIGDKAYMYNVDRDKWLTLESTAIQFGRNGSITTENLRYAGNLANQNSGALMPFNGTIIAITAKGATGDDTGLQLRVRNGTTTIATENFNLAGLEYIDTTTDIDFSSGDYLVARATDGSTTTSHISLTLWIKWRQ